MHHHIITSHLQIIRIICKSVNSYFTAFGYTHDDDDDDDGVYPKAVNVNLHANLQIIKSVKL